MRISELVPEDRERARAINVIRGVRSTLIPSQFLGIGNYSHNIRTPSIDNERRVLQSVRISSNFPLLLSDFRDPQPLLSKLGLLTLPEPPLVLYGKCVEGRDFNHHLNHEYDSLVSRDTAEECSFRILAPNVIWVDEKYGSSSTLEILSRNPYIAPGEEPVFDEKYIANAWVRKLCEDADRRSREHKRYIESAEQALIVANQEAGHIFLIQRLLESGGEAYLNDQLEKIRNLPNIISVTPSKDYSLLIKTSPTCTDSTLFEGIMYEPKYTGTWEISVNVVTRTVKARNIASPSGKIQCLHAYDSNNDKVCLGGYFDILNTGLRNLDYPCIVSNVLEYLRSFTPSDPLGRRHYKELPNSTKPPEHPHEFTTWMKIFAGERE